MLIRDTLHTGANRHIGFRILIPFRERCTLTAVNTFLRTEVLYPHGKQFFFFQEPQRKDINHVAAGQERGLPWGRDDGRGDHQGALDQGAADARHGRIGVLVCAMRCTVRRRRIHPISMLTFLHQVCLPPVFCRLGEIGRSILRARDLMPATCAPTHHPQQRNASPTFPPLYIVLISSSRTHNHIRPDLRERCQRAAPAVHA